MGGWLLAYWGDYCDGLSTNYEGGILFNVNVQRYIVSERIFLKGTKGCRF